MIKDIRMRKSDRVISLGKHVRRGARSGTRDNSYYPAPTPVRMRSSDKLTNVFRVKGRTTHAVNVDRNRVKGFKSESIDFGSKSSQKFLVNPASHIYCAVAILTKILVWNGQSAPYR